ncbi:MAG: EVE domain-containing protein [Candidatus Pacebacteria bacterium]|nr:EVE domain-containing protein [Candidatus Paceibacterota bacterium]
MKAEKKYWLMKTEPESYSIDTLMQDKKTPWTGVRNFQARNYIREMRPGDGVLFYHSSCKVPGVYGIAKVASQPYPDPTQFDPQSHYYDPRATKEKPMWDVVDVSFVKKLQEPVTLSSMRAESKLRAMILLQPGSRLSVTPVAQEHFEYISARK